MTNKDQSVLKYLLEVSKVDRIINEHGFGMAAY